MSLPVIDLRNHDIVLSGIDISSSNSIDIVNANQSLKELFIGNGKVIVISQDCDTYIIEIEFVDVWHGLFQDDGSTKEVKSIEIGYCNVVEDKVEIAKEIL